MEELTEEEMNKLKECVEYTKKGITPSPAEDVIDRGMYKIKNINRDREPLSWYELTEVLDCMEYKISHEDIDNEEKKILERVQDKINENNYELGGNHF